MCEKIVKSRRRLSVKADVVYEKTNPVFKPSQRQHDLIRARIVSGVTSSTGMFDDSIGDVPDLFNPTLDKFDLSNKLMAERHVKLAQDLASK